MASGYKINGNDLYDLYHQYAECTQTNFTNYKIGNSDCLKLVPYSSVDTWTNKLELPKYKWDGTPIAIPEPGTKPAFHLIKAIIGPNKDSANTEVENLDFWISRTDSALTINGETFSASTFCDGVVPTRIILACSAGGGQGAPGDYNRDGAGGGGGGYWGGIVNLKDNNIRCFMKPTHTYKYTGHDTSNAGGDIVIGSSTDNYVIQIHGGSGAKWWNSGRTGTGGSGGAVDYAGSASYPPWVLNEFGKVTGGTGGDSTSDLVATKGGSCKRPALAATNVPGDKNTGLNYRPLLNRAGGSSGKITESGQVWFYYGGGGGAGGDISYPDPDKPGYKKTVGSGQGGNGGSSSTGFDGSKGGGGGGGAKGDNGGGGGGLSIIAVFY